MLPHSFCSTKNIKTVLNEYSTRNNFFSLINVSIIDIHKLACATAQMQSQAFDPDKRKRTIAKKGIFWK